jgi:hypothetical protein
MKLDHRIVQLRKAFRTKLGMATSSPQRVRDGLLRAGLALLGVTNTRMNRTRAHFASSSFKHELPPTCLSSNIVLYTNAVKKEIVARNL